MGKTFRTAAAKQKVDFTIEGGDGDEYEEFSEYFVCRGAMPAGIIMEFGELYTAMSSTQEQTQEESMATGVKLLNVVQEFFDAALSRKDRDRFNALLKDPDKPVEMQTLMEVMNYLSGEFTARPTGEPSSTTSPVNSTGDVSTDGLLPADTTFSRPQPTPAGLSA